LGTNLIGSVPDIFSGHWPAIHRPEQRTNVQDGTPVSAQFRLVVATEFFDAFIHQQTKMSGADVLALRRGRSLEEGDGRKVQRVCRKGKRALREGVNGSF
jgi:hypothetical protein